jgi:hypothetical protein
LVALIVWNPTRTLAQQPAFLTNGLVACQCRFENRVNLPV